MSTSESPSDSTPHPIRDRLATLRAKRDELRVTAHLAGMDARSAWERVEARFTALEARAEAATEHASDEAAHSLDEFGKVFHAFRQKLDRIAHDWSRDDAP